MEEETKIIFGFFILLAIVSISGYFVDKSRDSVKIACYEAAKTNQNIRCDK